MENVFAILHNNGVNEESVDYLIKTLKRLKKDINCSLTRQLLNLEKHPDINNTFIHTINIHLITHLFKNFEKFLEDVLKHEMSKESELIIRLIATVFFPVLEISKSKSHFAGFVSNSIDTYASIVSNGNTDKSIITEEIKLVYSKSITMINDVKTFICSIENLNSIYKNNFEIYLENIIDILKNYPLGLTPIAALVTHAMTCYHNGVEICINCDTCDQKETCENKFETIMN